MILGPSDAEFHVELDGIKKCLHRKWPKQRDSITEDLGYVE